MFENRSRMQLRLFEREPIYHVGDGSDDAGKTVGLQADERESEHYLENRSRQPRKRLEFWLPER